VADSKVFSLENRATLQGVRIAPEAGKAASAATGITSRILFFKKTVKGEASKKLNSEGYSDQRYLGARGKNIYSP